MVVKLLLRQHNRFGFSLVEVLCTIAIIGVLAGLLLGPVARAMHRAQAMKWGDEAPQKLHTVIHRLRAQFQGKANFPTVTLQQLEDNQWLDSSLISFLKDRRVSFIPFKGSDPEDQVIIAVKIESGFLTEAQILTEKKEAITKPPE